MSVIDTLITDRTQADVNALIASLKAGSNPADSKGAYNASDLNRVGVAIDYVKLRLYEAGITADIEDFDISYSLPGVAIPLSPTQDGTGTPAPNNVRQIYPATKISGVGDIYVGTLDGATGILTVNSIAEYFDGSETWGSESTTEGVGYYCNLTNNGKMVGRKSGALYDELQMNWLAVRTGGDTTNPNAFVGASGTYINIRRTSFVNTSDLRRYLASTPLMVVFPLATAVTYQLNSQQIQEVAKQFGTQYVTIKPDARTKSDWTNTDIPTESQMRKYLSGVSEILANIKEYRAAAKLPESMRELDYIGANQIEDLLKETELAVTRILLSYRGYSGRHISGVNCLP